MHPRFTHLILLFLSVSFLKGENADSVKSYLWGLIQFKPEHEIEYEPGYMRDRILHRREFHDPVAFLPAEVRYGIFFYGGGTDDAVSSKWITYDEIVPGFDGGAIAGRVGHQLDIDFIKTNLFYKILKASWLDMHSGLNVRYSNLFVPGKIEQINSWGSINPNWDTGYTRFAPRIFTFGLSHTMMLQWFESWYIDSRYTWGYAFSSLYMNNKDELLSSPSGSGPSMTYSIGPRYIIDLGLNSGNEKGTKTNRFTVGLDLRYAYTKLNTINDPDDLTPIKKIHLQDFGIHLTFSVLYGGKLTTGDQGKEFYYRGDFVSAKNHFESFLDNYPDHANRNKAEMYLAESKKKIPIQLYREGLEFERKGLTNKAIDRFLSARVRATGNTKKLIQEKLDHIAILEIEKAELLAVQGRADEAISLMKAIEKYSIDAREKIPYFEAMQLFQEGEKALKFGFYSKSLELLDQALKKDPGLEFEVNTLRYQVATHLVELANTINDHAELRSAIQLLVDANALTGGLGEKNEKVLSELEEKFDKDQEREIAANVDQRMAAVRLKEIEKRTKPPLIVGMTIPDIQSLLGPPQGIVEKKDEKGTFLELWIYPLETGGKMYLTIKDYILIKIEQDT